MQLQRHSAEKPDLTKLSEMNAAMLELLDKPESSTLPLENLLALQDDMGSFNLLDSCKQVPMDARVEFCHTPTCVGTAILMRELLAGRSDLTNALRKALGATLRIRFDSHYMASFIKGGIGEFLETQRTLCPQFHNMIHNYIHDYNSAMPPYQDSSYYEAAKNLVSKGSIRTRFYIAYGSNMDRQQMLGRCPDAVFAGTTYIKNWQLTMPFYANIIPAPGRRTPAIVWKITAQDESELDRYEGYPSLYDKKNIIITVNDTHISALAYVMTDEYKNCTDKKARPGYEELIMSAYKAAGFSESEYLPYRY